MKMERKSRYSNNSHTVSPSIQKIKLIIIKLVTYSVPDSLLISRFLPAMQRSVHDEYFVEDKSSE
jgi:hypothetical protein